jgi:hypothetical protein
LAVLMAGCIPASSHILGTWGHPTREYAERSGAVITRTEVSPSANPAGSCTVAPAGVCGGCTVTCPVNRQAQCGSGVTRPADGGRAAACTREATCSCG